MANTSVATSLVAVWSMFSAGDSVDDGPDASACNSSWVSGRRDAGSSSVSIVQASSWHRIALSFDWSVEQPLGMWVKSKEPIGGRALGSEHHSWRGSRVLGLLWLCGGACAHGAAHGCRLEGAGVQATIITLFSTLPDAMLAG